MPAQDLKIKINIIDIPPSIESIDWLFKTIKDTAVQNITSSFDFQNLAVRSKKEIFVFNLNFIDSALLEKFKEKLEDADKNNLFFSLSIKDSKNIYSLARLGFNHIYYYPDEEFVLRNDVSQQVSAIKEKIDFETNKDKIHKKFSFENLIGTSPKFLECIEIAKRVANKSDTTVLLLGETGTGKELLAKAIHFNSERADFPFIELNTSAISETLFESELFGYEKGAFTDAKASKPGLFEIAEGGTIFLDEIGDLNLSLQVKLLKAIENKSIKRVGGIKDININCRIITATNQNLEKLIEEKRFRTDLYYRLKVISIYLPPLRERMEDIIPLTEHFIKLFNKKYDADIRGITKKAKQVLLQYNWPGNVRELSNVIERAVLLCDSKIISDKDLQIGSSIISSSVRKNIIEFKVELDKANIQNISHDLAVRVLNLVDGNKSQAAKILGISRPSLLKILRKKI